MNIRPAIVTRGASIATAALFLTAAASTAHMPYQGEGHVMLAPDDLEWGPVASMAAPAQITVIEGNLGEAVPFAIRLKLPAGYDVLPHVHPEYERVTVIQLHGTGPGGSSTSVPRTTRGPDAAPDARVLRR